MLNKLALSNFKSARNLEVPLNQLTVLSGLNGSGKSTVLQSLCLIRQSYLLSFGEQPQLLHLQGPLVQLGRSEDVLSDRAENGIVQIGFEVDGVRGRCFAEAQEDSDVLVLQANSELLNAYFRDCHFQYLQADRLTPQSHYNRSDATSRDAGFLGAHGEHTPDFLAVNGDRLEVSERRRCILSAEDRFSLPLERIIGTPKLYDQITGWLQYLSPGVRLNARHLSHMDLVSLTFSYTSTELAQNSGLRRPVNVGFGLTYCLPILTACLAAPAGALLLIENPEAHLHPRGQVAMGALLAKCAADGVQILVETHSDHILNGIRLAVKHREIGDDQVQLCNFTRNPVTGDSYIEIPHVLPNGDLTAWPDGFFDEWEKSLEALLR